MAQRKWDMAEIGDQRGTVAIVTGSSSGIGLETARVLAIKGATVILAVRSQAKGRSAVDRIAVDAPEGAIRVMDLDLADLASVKGFADTFLNDYDRLDLLINNAGVMIPPYATTSDGFELQFGTNHLGHFALTGLLMERLMETGGSRVVNLSSTAHKWGAIDFSDLNWERRRYKKWQAYGDSKVANLLFTHALRERFSKGEAGVRVAAAHPGWTATELQRHTGLVSVLNHLFAQTTAMGALPTLYAATAQDVRSGDFFGPGGLMEMRGYPRRVRAVEGAYDREAADRLWEISESLTGVTFPTR